MIKQAVIIAGGRGTRLAPFTDSSPKPMYPIHGKPFITYLISQIRSFGIERIVLLLGYLPDIVMEYLKDGSGFGVAITYDVTPEEYETGDRMRHAREKLDDEFLFMYCDNYCPINYERLVEEYYNRNSLIQITAYRNDDLYTRNNLLVDQSDGKVLCYDKARKRTDLSGVDIGYAVINKKTIDFLNRSGLNFEAFTYPILVDMGKLYTTFTEHRYYSVGSWERMSLTEAFFEDIPTAFLDRDGTINVRPPRACYIEKPEEFVWLEGAKEAIKLLKDNGWRVILITNQPGIARGRLTVEVLESIHKKMQSDLIEYGVKGGIDDVFYCPHNWDEGCECRKPKPGMFYQAQKKYSLDLTKCVMIGDDDRDIEAGRAAGCKCVKVGDDYDLLKAVKTLMDCKGNKG